MLFMKKREGGGAVVTLQRERERAGGRRRGEREREGARGVIGGWCARDAQAELHNQRSGGVPKSRTPSARPPDCRWILSVAPRLFWLVLFVPVNSGVCRLESSAFGRHASVHSAPAPVRGVLILPQRRR